MRLPYDDSLYATPITRKPTVTIGGVDIRSFGVELLQIPEPFLPLTRTRRVTIDTEDGEVDLGSTYGISSFSLEGIIVGTTTEDLEIKKSLLKEWLSQHRSYQSEFSINQVSVRAIPMELSLNLWYSEGTISVTQASFNITGTSTEFLLFAKEGAIFEVEGDTSNYYISKVTSDTALLLDSSISRASGSGLSYRIQRRRYLLVSYNGSSSLDSSMNRGFHSETPIGTTRSEIGSAIQNFSIGFDVVYPYFVGDRFSHAFTSVANNTFKKLKGIGRARLRPEIRVTSSGTSTNPKIYEANKALAMDFRGSLLHKNTILSESSGTYDSGSEKYSITSSGVGASLGTTDRILLDSQIINGDALTILFRLKKDSVALGASNSIIDVFNSTSSRTDGVYVYCDANGHVSVDMTGTSSTTTAYMTGASSPISVNIESEIAIIFDKDGWKDAKDNNTYYAKILMDGMIADSKTSLPANRPDQMLIDVELGNVNVGTVGLSCIMDWLAIYNYALSDEEVVNIFVDSSKHERENDNTSFSFTGSIESDDILLVERNKAEFYDNSEVSITNVMDTTTGRLSVKGDSKEESIVLFQTTGTIGEVNMTIRPTSL